MILAADIGGTKTLLGLFADGQCQYQCRLTNTDFSNFAEVLAAFLNEAPEARIDRACFALAGPVAAGQWQARLTNLPWLIDAHELARQFDLPSVNLVNDFVAAAMGAVSAEPDHLVTLQTGLQLDDSPGLVVGAGTGLGMAIVLPQATGAPKGTPRRVVASEGGHAAFAPTTKAQVALWDFAHARHERVTWERVVSGPGLSLIHEFHTGTSVSAEEISALALAKPNSPAGESLDLFLSIYGAFAGDMALTSLAHGGVYLAGGIAAKVLPAMQHGGFRAAFNAKSEHSAIVESIAIHVVTDPLVGLIGAAHLAMNRG
jgi:glucokinase